jgi:Putative collagen-binding domain of a collagenase
MISEKERDSFRGYSWFEALDQPGAWQMKILRDFLESRDLSQCLPGQDLLIEQNHKLQDVTDEHIQACIEKEGKFACLYFPSGGQETVDLSRLKIDHLQVWWFNPRDGQCYTQENVITDKAVSLEAIKPDGEIGVLKLITPTRGNEQDWVCVIENRNNQYKIPGEAKIYGELPVPPEIKKTFMW